MCVILLRRSSCMLSTLLLFCLCRPPQRFSLPFDCWPNQIAHYILYTYSLSHSYISTLLQHIAWMGPLLASTLYLHILIWAIASLTMLKFFALIYADISNCSAVSWNFAKQIKFVMKWTFAQKTWFSKEDFDFKTVFTVDLENLAWTEHSESQGNMPIFHSLSLRSWKKRVNLKLFFFFHQVSVSIQREKCLPRGQRSLQQLWQGSKRGCFLFSSLS